jgi:hypothetical protein
LHSHFVKTILLPVKSPREQSPVAVNGPQILIALLAFLILLFGSQASAQQEGAGLRIEGIDSSRFPVVVVSLAVSDAENSPIVDLPGLRLREDGVEIDDYATERHSLGSDIVFVIDANTSIEQRDETDGPTRREKVRDSIARYANHFMDPVQLDRVSIIVPDGEGGRYLGKQRMSFPNEVVNAVNFYETGQLDNTPLDAMMEMAFYELGARAGEGRSQALFLFSDAGQIQEQLDLQALAARAESEDVSILVAILGARADPQELDNARLLSEASGGDYVHMPEPAASDPLYESIQGRGTRSLLTYRSQANQRGQHVIEAEFAGSRDEAVFDLIVEPPAVQIAVDNSRPIRRVAESADTPLEEIAPQRQPLVAQVSWPDGYPRLLTSAMLLVNGEEMPLEAPILDNAGLLTFDWDIRALEAGTYDLQLQITDELGLESLSEALPLTIEIQRPEAEATAPPPTSVPTPVPEAAPATFLSRLPGGALALWAGLVALLAFLLALVIGVVLVRRIRKSSRARKAAESAAGPAPTPTGDPRAAVDETLVAAPDFSAADAPLAYLTALENAAEHTGRIAIAGGNVALGRDQARAQIVFQDESVAQLHARIMESQGTYRITDEGSTSGTYVNYRRVGLTPHILGDKDELRLGRVRLRFRLVWAPEEIEATVVDGDFEDDEDHEADTQIYRPQE